MSCQICHKLLCKCEASPLYPSNGPVYAEDVIIEDSEDCPSNWSTLDDFIIDVNKFMEDMKRQISEHQRDLYELRGLKGILERQVNK